MTLTTILPSLRRSLPDPLTATLWPDHTHATTTDLVVSGISMVRLAELCSTPCVHTDDAFVVRGTRRPVLLRDAAVVVTRVESVVENADAERVVLIDASLDAVAALWTETRLIGRASTARSTRAVVLTAEAHSAATPAPTVVELPSDLRAGDLLVVPCGGMVTLHDVRVGGSVR